MASRLNNKTSHFAHFDGLRIVRIGGIVGIGGRKSKLAD